MMHWFWWGLPYFGMPWGYQGVGAIFMVLFWAVVIVLIVALVRGFSSGHALSTPSCHSHHLHSDNSEAMETLRKLYAEGKISEEEFEHRKKKLME